MYKQDLFWNNIPYKKNKVLRKMGFLDFVSKHSFLKNVPNPYYIWTGNGRILPLETMVLETKTINKLKKNQEIYFYLYEPLCPRIGDYNRSFYSEFKSDINLKDLISDEIESIKIFTKNNGIDKFRIFTSDYNIKLIKEKYPELNIDCLSVFIRYIACGYRDPKLKNNIEKKFWCGNWRYSVSRHLVMCYLSNLSGHYTWNLKCSFEELKKNDWFDLNKLKEEYPQKFSKIKEGSDFLFDNVLSIDTDIKPVLVEKFNEVYIPGKKSPSMSQQLLQTYKNSFCAIVNETRYAQPFGWFSEKTLTPIWSKIPFILVAPPHSLEYLKSFGFKTFDRWWDESYDHEEDHYKRLIKIFDLIDYIDSKSIEELKTIYEEMTEILNHNQQVISTIPMNSTAL